MRPMRGGGRVRFGLPGMGSASTKLALAIVGVSILTAAASAHQWMALVPALTISNFALWQPFTYAFIGMEPMEVLFSALIVWQMGSFFETTWGSKRTIVFALGTTFAAGVLTALLALVIPSLRLTAFGGAGVIASVMWVGYGLSFGKSQTNFWGMPISGYAFAGIGLLFIVLQAAFAGVRTVVPDVLAVGLAALYVRNGSPKVWWLRFQGWRLQRELKGRSKHLHIVNNSSRESDRFLN